MIYLLNIDLGRRLSLNYVTGFQKPDGTAFPILLVLPYLLALPLVQSARVFISDHAAQLPVYRTYFRLAIDIV